MPKQVYNYSVYPELLYPEYKVINHKKVVIKYYREKELLNQIAKIYMEDDLKY
tara:strand:+ start:325 stop:483 length:159 start_codon:yes stop_codon:yes gene_type:complete